MRTCFVVLVVALLAFGPVVSSSAQTRPPETYSVTMRVGNTTVKADRDGSKESLEQTVPRSANGPGMHMRQIYDFATHKYWTMDLEGGPCVVSTYTSPSLPSMFDPIGAVEETRAGLAQSKPVALRSETVNGIATKVYEMPVPEIKGKMRVFLEETHNFAVKMVMIPAGGKELTQMEVTSLSYAKPAATLFVPPQNCRVQGGESSATGGHAEADISATAAGQKNLGEPKPAAGAVEVEVPGGGAVPAHYTGPAPAVFQFTFEVNASGPVQVEWVLVNQGDTAWESGKLAFTAAGTKQLKIPVKIGVGNNQHWEGAGHLEVVVGGKRISSPTIKISADCKAK